MTPFTALVLAGGSGTRLAHLHPHLPKPMIPLAGRPFLEWVFAHWRRHGVGRFVVSLGHLAQVAEQHLETRENDGLEILTVTEPEPMGTGGAVRYAARQVDLGDPFLALNGDSLAVGDPQWPEASDGALLGVRVDDAARFGTLDIGADGRLRGFREKQPGAGLINAGVYLLRRRLLDAFGDATPLSIERDVFPNLLARGADLRVVPVSGPLLDIGTPESLAGAEKFLEQHAHH